LAGVDVPNETMQKAFAYLKKNTTANGGLSYTSRDAGRQGSERPALTVAAIACAHKPEEHNGDLAKKWLKFSLSIGMRPGAYETYTLFHTAQVRHGLGEDGWAKLYGQAEKGTRWTEYRKACFDDLLSSQKQDGSWDSPRGLESVVGPVFTSSARLVVLQLDNETVPIFSRSKH
jgi:hypothetical protein